MENKHKETTTTSPPPLYSPHPARSHPLEWQREKALVLVIMTIKTNLMTIKKTNIISIVSSYNRALD